MRGRRALPALLLLFGLALVAGADAAAPPLQIPARVPPAERTRLEAVARDAFVSTRVEGPGVYMRAPVFEYLLDHPVFASHVTRALGLARYRIWEEGGDLWLDDGWGTRGRFSVVYAAPGRRLYYARGAYEQRFLPDMRGEAIAVLDYVFRPEEDGRTLVETSAAGYLQIDSRFLRALGQVAMPFVQAKADKEAAQLLRVFARASRAIENDASQVYLKVSQRPDVPHRDLEEFKALLRLS